MSFLSGAISRITAAARAALTQNTTTAGRIVSESDTGEGYMDNGSSWDKVMFKNPMTTSQDTIVGGSSGNAGRLAVGSNGNILTVTAGNVGWAAPATSGTVTSVAATVPTGFAISGSPITTTGTLAITESTQAANKVKAGPTSGGAATPAYRALIADDLPAATTTAVGAVKSGFLFAATADKTVANTTTETSLVGTGVGTTTLPANCLTAGRSVRIKMYGEMVFSSIFLDEPTIRVSVGGSNAATLVPNLIASGAPADVTHYWELEMLITCRTAGAPGTALGQGRLLYSKDHSASSDATVLMAFTLNAASSFTPDTTGTLAVAVTAQWGQADANNTITCTNCTIELIG